MFGDLFDSPWKIAIIAVLIIVLFGARKLPYAARQLGQSMRILKSEVQGLHGDDPDPGAPGQVQVPPAQLRAPAVPVLQRSADTSDSAQAK